MQEQVPETAVQQVQRGVLHAAVVPVHRHPVVKRFLGGKGLVVVRIAIPEEIPAGTRPLGHGIGLPLRGGAAAGAGHVHPLGDGRQRALARVRGLILRHLRQQQGQVFFRKRHCAAGRAVDDGDGLTPVALPGKHPVPQLIVHLALAQAFLLQVIGHHLLGLGHRQAVKEAGVDQRALVNVAKSFFCDVAACHHLHNGQMKGGGKVPVPLVMPRHGHDGAGAVGHQHIVRHPHRHLLAGGGVGGG